MDLTAFADEVGATGPVGIAGARTQWHVGGALAEGTRVVGAPAGIVAYEPADMTLRCAAGTPVAEVDAATAERGQMVALDPRHPTATVGGVLAVGQSGVRRLRFGPVRDVLLEATFVSADGVLVKAGGPTVKNVSGFDLCRVLVGSLGTIGFLGEVVLRTLPRPKASMWFTSDDDPFALRAQLFQPSSLLWNGTTTWVLLEGHPHDVDAQAAAAALRPVAGPPSLPAGGRRSLRPRELRSLTGSGFMAEVGVGIVHTEEPSPPPASVPRPDLHERLKAAFDPSCRLNPGRCPPGCSP